MSSPEIAKNPETPAHSITFHSILDQFRREAASERDKGARFERLMRAWLMTEPHYAGQFKTVWLWGDFPCRAALGGQDTGIDLVALTTTGAYWAVQCKCYQETAIINKAEVDGFLATAGRSFMDETGQTKNFEHCLWIATTNNWGGNAEAAIHNHTPAVSRLSLFHLENSAVDWGKLLAGLTGTESRAPKHKPRPHQDTAIAAAQTHFAAHDRGQLIMACGTGKTFTALRIAERMAGQTGGSGLVLFLVPSIALLGQTLGEWLTHAERPIHPVCVCSDPQVSQRKTKTGAAEDSGGVSVVDLALPASTDAANILKQLRRASQNAASQNASPNAATHNAAANNGTDGMTVVFCTYQSIAVIARAQKEWQQQDGASVGIFDLVICDEAHRTTGVTLSGEDESAFVRVHDGDFIRARKRLYMTATPRLYHDSAKRTAAENDMVLCSMDDPALYGTVFHHIGFGEAVSRGLLSDYKVLILTVSEKEMPPAVQRMIAEGKTEIPAADVNKLIGCVNALSKEIIGDSGITRAADPAPMATAVAFCSSIKASKQITATFNRMGDLYYQQLPAEAQKNLVSVACDHVDGTMSAPLREQKLGWLKAAERDARHCNILSNVRCLSEGVDVPALDAVMFLSARNSQVDVVQSVGRVMRRAPGKKYGYIIIPIVTPGDVSGEKALDNNAAYAVVWTVLNALRAHDDRFAATVNKIELNRDKPDSIIIGAPTHGERPDNTEAASQDSQAHTITQLTLQFNEMQGLLYAKLVEKVGDRRYWEDWARNVADIAKREIAAIDRLVSQSGPHRDAFSGFLDGLRRNINPAIAAADAVEMLAQHLITQPVFEALFENYSFVKNNPVSQSMEAMLTLLSGTRQEDDTATLKKFYDSVRERAAGIDNAEARQRIIIELYDKFFRTAFPLMVERLGIVYTPVEVVDYIIRSVDAVLRREFDRRLGDENLHILDPFTGTGTFITRLLQSGLISPQDMARKYQREIHANEIVLLAYYIASVNIENVYHDLQGKRASCPDKNECGRADTRTFCPHRTECELEARVPNTIPFTPFAGICLTDTFQLGETDGTFTDKIFPVNSARVDAQRQAPLMVIIGNPPYSVGQKSANDNAQNQSYAKLERRIAETYAAASDASSVKSLYDAYIKAFRWSSDRLDSKNGGIICFVSNGAWIDTSGMAGFRACLEKEFSAIYVFNLRGNARTSGIIRQKEAGNIFDSGSRTPISITLLVKKPSHQGRAMIHYHDIGDYLSRTEKLAIISKFGNVENPEMNWQVLMPNKHNDWLNQRNDSFTNLIPLDPEKKFDVKTQALFTVNSLGLNTNRDAWIYNFSKHKMLQNMQSTIDFYNKQVTAYQKNTAVKNAIDFIDTDETKISWSSSLIPKVERNLTAEFQPDKTYEGIYRPFCKQYLYMGEHFIHRRGQFDQFFPISGLDNLVICIPGIGDRKGFACLITDKITDLHIFTDGAQCFPLYWYEDIREQEKTLFDIAAESQSSYYARRDGISDHILALARKFYGHKTTKEDVFYYVYALLHHPGYRQAFAADLKKMLPRLPMVEDSSSFWQFVKSGRALADLHLRYEDHTAGAAQLGVQLTGASASDDYAPYLVQKMRFAKSGKGGASEDKSQIIYNDHIVISNIPAVAYEYVVNGKSAIEWIMERYAITTHKESGIVNDPNDWSREHHRPRYILDLLLSIITLSTKTVELIKLLPDIALG